MKTLKLIGNRVAIMPLKSTNEKTPDGLFLIPNQHRSFVSTDDEFQYRVLAIGPGRWVKATKKGCPSHFEKPEVMAGDRVLVDLRYGGLLHDFEDGSHWLIVDSAKILMKW